MKKMYTLPLMLFLFLFGGGVNAQITLQQTPPVPSVTGSGTSITIPDFDVPAGSDRLLLVFVGKGAGAGPPNVTGITFNGQTWTVANNRAVVANSDNVGSEIWYGVISGTDAINDEDIVVSFGASAGDSQAGAASFTGVDAADPIGDTNSETNPISNHTNTGGPLTVNTTAGNVVVDCVRQSNSGSFDFGGQTELFDTYFSSQTTEASYKAASGSSVDMSWTSIDASGSANQYGYCAAELKKAAVVPVELQYFRAASADDEKVLLQWATASEIDNDFFRVERSVDGRNFAAIGKVRGAGNSLEELTYFFEDDQIPLKQSSLYYRLRQTDFDGAYEYSNIVSVRLEKAIDSPDIRIAPNPVKDGAFSLFLSADIEEADMHLYSTSGQLIRQQRLKDTHTEVPVETLEAGMYLLRVKVGGTVSWERIIIK